ncbi:MAG: hypothetical protein ACRDPA_03230, partial [Solirubrobacteraceae bacterium]
RVRGSAFPVSRWAGGCSWPARWLFAVLPGQVHSDTWIALVGGRDVVQHGIPGHETLTIAAYGRVWRDQQWLAQLWMYELYRLGGIGLVGFVEVALVFGALAGATWAALRLGARPRSLAWILPAAMCELLIGLEVRTQAYAYPLLVVVVYLLAADARGRGSRVWWCLPLLVLWGNLHGSAILGAGLVGLRGLTVGWERRRLGTSPRAWGKPLGLVLGAPLCLAINPYGFSIASYYRATVFNSELRKLIAEWQPITYEPVLAAVFALLAAVGVWSVIRHRERSMPWDRLALLAVGIGAIVAVRNLPWFALTALLLLPAWIDPSVRAPAWRSRWAGLLAAGVTAFGALWLLQGALNALHRSAAAATPDYPGAALAAVRGELAAHPGWRVYGDDYLADWLLWELPALRGSVATDARFELLSARQLRSEVDLVDVRGPAAASL